jgi:succinyl-CoA synthetase beta subunit
LGPRQGGIKPLSSTEEVMSAVAANAGQSADHRPARRAAHRQVYVGLGLKIARELGLVAANRDTGRSLFASAAGGWYQEVAARPERIVVSDSSSKWTQASLSARSFMVSWLGGKEVAGFEEIWSGGLYRLPSIATGLVEVNPRSAPRNRAPAVDAGINTMTTRSFSPADSFSATEPEDEMERHAAGVKPNHVSLDATAVVNGAGPR